MSSVSTDQYPYTARYVRELLRIDEASLHKLMEHLGVQPIQDPQTGILLFNHQDLERMRNTVDVQRKGQFPQGPKNTAMTAPNKPGSRMASSNSTGGDSLSTLVEAISSSKESILSEISNLLDDRLSGLDEVVVELIRCKTENDSLRQKLSHAVKEKEAIQEELGRFKPVQFGFYKKVGAK